MYEFHRMLATDLHRERLHEADRSRLVGTAKEPVMDLLQLIIVIAFGGLMLFGVLATFLGTDSRDSIGDWGRPIRF